MSDQTSQPTIDPALSDHLDELAALAREIGAEKVWIIREVVAASLFGDVGFDMPPLQYINLNLVKPDDPPGLLVILRFPASDGGAAGVEVK